VLFIFTLLIGGLAMPVVTQINNLRVSETRKTMDEAKQALLGWAITHASDGDGGIDGKVTYLPCPDLTAAGVGTPNDGQEDRNADGSCGGSEGNLPWVDLGLGDTDGWHNRLRYYVNADFADSSDGFKISTPAAGARVCTSSACTQFQANPVVAVIVSHGINGLGAMTAANVAAAAPTSADELEQTDGDGDFVARTSSAAGAAAGEFDDIAAWLTNDQLIGKLAGAGVALEP
jgi:hypothetical protein